MTLEREAGRPSCSGASLPPLGDLGGLAPLWRAGRSTEAAVEPRALRITLVTGCTTRSVIWPSARSPELVAEVPMTEREPELRKRVFPRQKPMAWGGGGKRRTQQRR